MNRLSTFLFIISFSVLMSLIMGQVVVVMVESLAVVERNLINQGNN